MKRIAMFFASAVLLLTGCNKTEEFTTHNICGEICYQFSFDKKFLPLANHTCEINSYNLAWPDKGAISHSAERELMYLCFGDSSSSNVNAAADNWLKSAFTFKDIDGVHVQVVGSLDENADYSYCKLESFCQQDSQLATFIIKNESFGLGAVHGFYSVDYLIIDKESGRSVHIADLVVDTNLLCEAIAYGIQDLDVNKGTRDCLFDEYINVGRMPMPRNFTIDSSRNSILVHYGLYEITPYYCGIQTVVLPIFWLSKHVPLTPYAKRLFGPGCSL